MSLPEGIPDSELVKAIEAVWFDSTVEQRLTLALSVYRAMLRWVENALSERDP